MYSGLQSITFSVHNLEAVVDFFSGLLKFPLKGLAPEVKAIYQVGELEINFIHSPNNSHLPHLLQFKLDNEKVFQAYLKAQPHFKKNPPQERTDFKGQKWLTLQGPEQICVEFALSEISA